MITNLIEFQDKLEYHGIRQPTAGLITAALQDFDLSEEVLMALVIKLDRSCLIDHCFDEKMKFAVTYESRKEARTVELSTLDELVRLVKEENATTAATTDRLSGVIIDIDTASGEPTLHVHDDWMY